ncbi:hypothetical protein [Saccharomonospora sp. CUA-673]|uniref:hypothetical protein n=1 Tax=Saccharomonospora sp. CUA-673 TaxID=1904969 RepID=UPI003514F694
MAFGRADGFNVMPPVLPAGLTDFVEQVVPILRERGLFRSEYRTATLREHYGLPRPANRYFDPEAGDRALPPVPLREGSGSI